MNITPHLGIGDLLIIKMKQLSNELTIDKININTKLIRTYCENYDLKLYSTEKLINLLFPTSSVALTSGDCDFYTFDHYPIYKCYIYDDINHSFSKKNNTLSDYIVFHTKLRHDGLIDKFKDKILPSLKLVFDNLKMNKTIIIMGERNIGDNVETRIHKTISLYENLSLLKKNNHVIDLTVDILTSGNSSFDSFLNDIELINKAVCNISFGIGGSFNICQAFSKKNVSFIPFYNECPYKNTIDKMFSVNNTLIESIDELKKKLHEISSL